MAKLCQKLPVVFEIDPEKNGYGLPPAAAEGT